MTTATNLFHYLKDNSRTHNSIDITTFDNMLLRIDAEDSPDVW